MQMEMSFMLLYNQQKQDVSIDSIGRIRPMVPMIQVADILIGVAAALAP